MAKKKKDSSPEPSSNIENEEPKIDLGKMIRADRFRFTVGVVFLAYAIFLLFAIVSYLFTWWRDFDQLTHISLGQLLMTPEHGLHNITGSLGAKMAHAFVFKGFGIASVAFVFISLFIGLRFLHMTFFKLRRVIIEALFILVWLCVAIGYIALYIPRLSVFAGQVGYETAYFLQMALGDIGSLVLIVVSLILFGVIAYNIQRWFRQPLKNLNQHMIERKQAKPEAAATDLSEEMPESSLASVPSNVSDEVPTEPLPDWQNITLKNVTEPLTEAAATPPSAHESSAQNEVSEIPFIIETASQDSEDTVSTEDEDTFEGVVKHHGIDKPYDPYEDLKSFRLPGIDLLETYGVSDKVDEDRSDELLRNKRMIETTLKNFGIEISQIKATVGPTVTLYEIIPGVGVRISKIKNLEDDIALSLSALGIRIIAPIPGKGTIGIEVPNEIKQIVPMRIMLQSKNFAETHYDLPIALGKTIQNECYVFDLAKMPHMLIAGATGQGKSVGLNAIIASLVYKKHPADLKFVLVDPKKVELTLYNKIERHYLAKLPDSEDAIITDTKKVVRTLNSLGQEMDIRYNLLKDAQVKNIKEYNAKFIQRRLNPIEGHRYLPYIVLVIDEFADLIMTAGKEVELPIARLAQLARAIGIHLIVATQRPSVNIITGTIKANFPARVAFRVTSKIDSRTILDAGGAEQLIGKGDLLLSTGNDMLRLQCALIDTPEIERIADFIGEQRGYPSAFELPDMPDETGNSSGGSINIDERDPLFEEVAELIVSTQQGSTSLIQRKLKLGYNRAGRLMDQLEDSGIVGPSQGSKAREVLIKDLHTLQERLQSLNT